MIFFRVMGIERQVLGGTLTLGMYWQPLRLPHRVCVHGVLSFREVPAAEFNLGGVLGHTLGPTPAR